MYLTLGQIENAIYCPGLSLESGGIFQTHDELKRAETIWKELNETYNITAAHYGAIESLKSANVYPAINLEDAQKLLTEHVCDDEDEREIIMELLAIWKSLSSKC